MNLNISFLIPAAQEAFECTARNICLSGGFGSTKTYTMCQKVLLLCVAFKRYRVGIGRYLYKDLLATTYKTFEKICPPELIAEWDKQRGYMKFKNGSEIMWMHLDDFNEEALKGFECNSFYLDQPEEISEAVYTVLDGRVGRWDMATPDPAIVKHEIPRNEFGRFQVPNYMLLSPNPDTETHWIYRYYHPDSEERIDGHAYFEVSSLDNPALNKDTLRVMMSRDPSWVRRFVYGKWGISERQIHLINKQSYLSGDLLHPEKDVTPEWLEKILDKSELVRVLDHGDAAPTAVSWWATHRPAGKNYYIYIAYREYYVPGRSISYHRGEISALSKGERYRLSLADPSIFRLTQQKNGNYWTTADEYASTEIEGEPLILTPADNNELATRNRINEYLALKDGIYHPVTGETPAPQLYFIRRTAAFPNGVKQMTIETNSQVREKLDELNGKPIYSDERDKAIADHAYDTLRYFVASHFTSRPEAAKIAPPNSFRAHKNRLRALKQFRGLRSIA